MNHHSRILRILPLTVLAALSACDAQEPTVPGAVHRAEVEASLSWEGVPSPASSAPSSFTLAPEVTEAPGFDVSVENFHFATSDMFAVTSPPGGLFAPIPADIEPFTEPLLAEGFFLGTRFRDDDDNVIGFGLEQEVLNLQTARGVTTYTINLPGRGTLMVRQDEDVQFLLDEVDDMVASNELVRSYEPSLDTLNSVPGTGRVIGGTGEFAGAFGIVREFGSLHEINLATGVHDLEVHLQVLLVTTE